MSQRHIKTRRNGWRSGTGRVQLALSIGGLALAGQVSAVEVPALRWDMNSPGYVAKAQTCDRALGSSSASCATPMSWGPDLPNQAGPILTWDEYEDAVDPVNNRYYDWINYEGYNFRINTVTLDAAGAVGTDGSPAANPKTNQVGIGTGSGISAAWELSDAGTKSRIEGAAVQIKSGVDRDNLQSWGLTSTTGRLVPGSSGTWLTSVGAVPTPNQTPVQTTIVDREFSSPLSPDDRLIAESNVVRIQFYQTNGDTDYASAVLGDVGVTFGIDTANIAAADATAYSRVGGTDAKGTQGKATVTVTNTPGSGNPADGLIASGVSAPAKTTGNFRGSGANWTPIAPHIAPDQGRSTTYSFLVPEFAAYGPGSPETLVLDTGDAPGDTPDAPDPADRNTLSLDLTGTAVGPTASVSGWGGASREAQKYSQATSIDTRLERQDLTGYYRDLTFSNIFGTISGLDAAFTDLTLGLSSASNGVRLFELVGGVPGNEILVGGQSGRISTGHGDQFRVYLSGATSGDLLITTDMYRDLGVTSLSTDPLRESYVFRFDLSGAAPLPGTLALIGIGLFGLGWRRPAR